MRAALLLALVLALAVGGCGGDDGGGSPASAAEAIESCLEDAGLDAAVAPQSSIEADDVAAGVKAEVRSVAASEGLAEVVRIFDDDAAAQAWVDKAEKEAEASGGPDIVAYEKVGRTSLEEAKQGSTSDKLRACAQENG